MTLSKLALPAIEFDAFTVHPVGIDSAYNFDRWNGGDVDDAAAAGSGMVSVSNRWAVVPSWRKM